MNERIEKLLEQCQIETYGVNGELLEIGFDAEKFALLIVQECIETLRLVPYSDSDKEFGDEVIYQDAIRKHFGVD